MNRMQVVSKGACGRWRSQQAGAFTLTSTLTRSVLDVIVNDRTVMTDDIHGWPVAVLIDDGDAIQSRTYVGD